MKFGIVHSLTPHFQKLYGKSRVQKLRYFYGIACKESPEIVFASFLSLLGVFSSIRCRYLLKTRKRPRHYRDITIFRHDDPVVETLTTTGPGVLQRKFK